MAKSVRVVRIDPRLRRVEAMTVDGSLAAYQRLVGGHIELCARLAPGVEMWGNETGRYKPKPLDYWQLTEELGAQIFVGPAFISGVNKRGDDISGTAVAVADVWEIVRFLTVDEARLRWPVMEVKRRERAEAENKRREVATGQSWHLMFIESPFPEDER